MPRSNRKDVAAKDKRQELQAQLAHRDEGRMMGLKRLGGVISDNPIIRVVTYVPRRVASSVARWKNADNDELREIIKSACSDTKGFGRANEEQLGLLLHLRTEVNCAAVPDFMTKHGRAPDRTSVCKKLNEFDPINFSAETGKRNQDSSQDYDGKVDYMKKLLVLAMKKWEKKLEKFNLPNDRIKLIFPIMLNRVLKGFLGVFAAAAPKDNQAHYLGKLIELAGSMVKGVGGSKLRAEALSSFGDNLIIAPVVLKSSGIYRSPLGFMLALAMSVTNTLQMSNVEFAANVIPGAKEIAQTREMITRNHTVPEMLAHTVVPTALPPRSQHPPSTLTHPPLPVAAARPRTLGEKIGHQIAWLKYY